MLQVAGIHAFYVPVDSRRGLVDPKDPSLAGDHMISAIEIPADVQDPRLKAIVKAADGKRYLIFDPTDERTPAGNLGSALQGSYGTLAAGASSQVIALPVLGPSRFGGANIVVQKEQVGPVRARRAQIIHRREVERAGKWHGNSSRPVRWPRATGDSARTLRAPPQRSAASPPFADREIFSPE